jgi:hypothetical protein
MLRDECAKTSKHHCSAKSHLRSAVPAAERKIACVTLSLALIALNVGEARASDQALASTTANKPETSNTVTCYLSPRPSGCPNFKSKEDVGAAESATNGDQRKENRHFALALRQTRPAYPEAATDLRREDGTGQIVVGATLAGLGAVSGVLSLISGISAYQSANVERGTATPDLHGSTLTASEEHSGGAARDGLDEDEGSDPPSVVELRRMSVGFALGAGVLLSAGGVLVYRGLLARREVALYVRPMVGRRRSLLQVRASF